MQEWPSHHANTSLFVALKLLGILTTKISHNFNIVRVLLVLRGFDAANYSDAIRNKNAIDKSAIVKTVTLHLQFPPYPHQIEEAFVTGNWIS